VRRSIGAALVVLAAATVTARQNTPIYKDATALVEILAGLGYRPVFRYEKYRTVYRRIGRPGLAMLDETPIGNFLELEGSPRSIDRMAGELGYSGADYILDSYGKLYLDHCARAGVRPRDMIFQRS